MMADESSRFVSDKEMAEELAKLLRVILKILGIESDQDKGG